VRVLIVTGTGTGVGKTVVTAALAALALDRGERVAVLKPAQTGVAPDSRRTSSTSPTCTSSRGTPSRWRRRPPPAVPARPA
jgi:dethiobiotin synthetase